MQLKNQASISVLIKHESVSYEFKRTLFLQLLLKDLTVLDIKHNIYFVAQSANLDILKFLHICYF